MEESKNNTSITKKLLLDLFKQVGCTPTILEPGVYEITYDNFSISIQVNDRTHSLTLFDVYWHKVYSLDFDEVLRIQKRVNYINSCGRVKMVMHKMDDDYIYISTLYTIPFVEEIPNLHAYMVNGIKCLLSYRESLDNKDISVEQKEV